MVTADFHPATRSSLRADVERLGICPGDCVLVHAGLRQFGPILGGPDDFIAALCDAVGSEGTILGYASWDGTYEDLLDDNGRLPDPWRHDVTPYDPKTSRATKLNGVFPEFLRTTRGAIRSGNPGASIVALGRRAVWLTENHPLDYGYGPGSPLARLIEANGKVLMAGAPWDTMTLLHHAEHLAPIENKHVRRIETPFATTAGTEWRMIEEYDTSDPVVDGLGDNCFEQIVTDFVDAGFGTRGTIAHAPALVVDAAPICLFAIDWLVRTTRGLVT